MSRTLKSLRTLALMTAPIALLAISGCATPFKADVSRFQQLPPAQGQSFVVRAADPKDDGGIEFGQYAGLVTQRMRSLGYVPAAPGTRADLNVLFDYGVDQGKERQVVTRDPFYDPFWGYGGGYGGGYGVPVRTRHGIRYVPGFYDPFLYGGFGYGSGFGRGYDVDSFTVYTSGIDLKIKRASDGQNLFEGKAEAKSRSNKLTYLVPNLVEAMFTGFPGNSGETVRISVAPEGK
jgi:Domain of unknown function (DUF4136)